MGRTYNGHVGKVGMNRSLAEHLFPGVAATPPSPDAQRIDTPLAASCMYVSHNALNCPLEQLFRIKMRRDVLGQRKTKVRFLIKSVTNCEHLWWRILSEEESCQVEVRIRRFSRDHEEFVGKSWSYTERPLSKQC